MLVDIVSGQGKFDVKYRKQKKLMLIYETLLRKLI